MGLGPTHADGGLLWGSPGHWCPFPDASLSPGPFGRDGAAVAVLPIASCPTRVWCVPPLPHQSNTNLGTLGRTFQKGGAPSSANSRLP